MDTMFRRKSKDRIKVKVTLRVTETGGFLNTTVIGPTRADIDHDIVVPFGMLIDTGETTYV
jgi:hypothetical protein